LKKPKIGLVFSGGGARGIAQIGVLKALEEAGLEPDFIVGTSVGSIVGGLYASGYSVDRLEQTVRAIDWEEILELSKGNSRTNLLVDQKPISDRSILTLILDGFRPMLPVSVSNGQNLTNLLNQLVLQTIYQTNWFDDFHIPFRAVATDLYTGKRVVLQSGNLAAAMRASATVPVLYSPFENDSMALVDGGLRSNIPCDVAKAAGCDIIIAVNTTSPLRTKDQIRNPLEALDQVMNLLMEQNSSAQLALADIVVTPEITDYAASDFSGIDSLLHRGYCSMKRQLPDIVGLYKRWLLKSIDPDLNTTSYSSLSDYHHKIGALHTVVDSPCMDSLFRIVRSGASSNVYLTYDPINPEKFQIETIPFQTIKIVTVRGAESLEMRSLSTRLDQFIGSAFCAKSIRRICESVLEMYREQGLPFTDIDSLEFDSSEGSVSIHVKERSIGTIRVSGNVKTDDVVILREFPLKEGAVFRVADAEIGMDNISALNLFHQVSFDVERIHDTTNIIIHVEEKPSRALQFGLLINNERNGQLAIELRDKNLFGTGSELSGIFFGGLDNRKYAIQYKSNRLFYTNLNFGIDLYYDLKDFKQYSEVEGLPLNKFDRDVRQLYRRTALGGSFSAGMYVEKFGNLSGVLRFEKQQLYTIDSYLSTSTVLAENHFLVSLGVNSKIDTQDRYPYPRSGMLFDGLYEFGQRALGSQVSFTRLFAAYEFYSPTLTKRLIFHPKVRFGYGDMTLPKTEEFRIGDISSFMGMRENEFNGRQLFVANMEIRYQLPIQILFDSFISFRYDIGRAWEIPEQIKFKDLRHGVGIILGLDTPIGPADFGIGKSFLILRGNPEFPLRWGPTYMYFSIGVGL